MTKVFAVISNKFKPTDLLVVARQGQPRALRNEAQIFGSTLPPIKPGKTLGSLSSFAFTKRTATCSSVPLYATPK
ncbi:hypothetical protein NSK_008727 [Nannochloropsis salina CCMP1776]|uniref:Uncharacterized protein n=1 Tax=Nannochloropsis salina CCMP1776 TaxID=1027361 RepID=A0A4D9CT50_9STRA|nr:hypothetical protein NSK_008727 [Nannochloropsis salina CCMP1776]|eukprot:TFJ79919.1 hypothetical protein NSK_008727 [Nannochloropsis salina CCMP1776]